MDFFPGVARAVTLPSAVTHPELPLEGAGDGITVHDWSESPLNPASRIDTLDDAFSHNDWTIDGAEPDGCQVWAIPSFARGRPPLRIDVYVGGTMFMDAEGKLNPQISLLRLLDLHKLPLAQPRNCRALGVARHICNALQYWSLRTKNFETKYCALPFGSHISIKKLEVDPRRMACEFAPDHGLERQWLTVEALQILWELPESRWPPIIDHSELRFVRQLRDSISLVEIIGPSGDFQMHIFKCVMLDVKLMYRELRTLLSVDSHPHTQGPPVYVVTKKVRFGGKRGVCGFVIEYMPLGSLQDHLMNSSSASEITPRQRLRWMTQIVDVMMHVRQSPLGYYSDLKLSNFLLRRSELTSETDVVLIDFEQRTPWYNEAPPEISWIDFLERLSREPDSGQLQQDCLAVLDSLKASAPNANVRDTYDDDSISHGTAFLYLSSAEREKAMVYMIGKIIWRIFEGAALSLEPISLDSFLAQRDRPEFPYFKVTPVALRSLITRCISTSSDWVTLTQGFGVSGGQVVMKPGFESRTGRENVARDVQAAAKAWWRSQINMARCYCAFRISCNTAKSDAMSGATVRPSLKEVQEQIRYLWADIQNSDRPDGTQF